LENPESHGAAVAESGVSRGGPGSPARHQGEPEGNAAGGDKPLIQYAEEAAAAGITDMILPAATARH
jgi:hypothetical protein